MIRIYTDGACSGNPGPGGSAFIVVKNDELVHDSQFSFERTTNNIMELHALIEALQYIIDNKIPECKIYSDSKYVVDGINEWMPKWMDRNWIGSTGKTIKNVELWQDVASLWSKALGLSNIYLLHVKGHSGDQWNTVVDKKAVRATKIRKTNYE